MYGLTHILQGKPINAAGRLAGAAHVARAHRVCLACNSGAVGDEMHLVFECTALASLRSRRLHFQAARDGQEPANGTQVMRMDKFCELYDDQDRTYRDANTIMTRFCQASDALK
ncbi:TPA: hypothetical protein ACH3X1_011961 [Trebouxia sp. C0004]